MVTEKIVYERYIYLIYQYPILLEWFFLLISIKHFVNKHTTGIKFYNFVEDNVSMFEIIMNNRFIFKSPVYIHGIKGTKLCFCLFKSKVKLKRLNNITSIGSRYIIIQGLF